MRLSALATVLLLCALAAPLAAGQGRAPVGAPGDHHASAPELGLPAEAERLVEGVVRPSLPEGVEAPDAGLVDKAGLLPGEGDEGSRSFPEAVAEAAPPALAAAGALALFHAFGGLRFLAVGAFAAYSRLTKSELLDNEHRDKVFRLIRESPGLGLTEIMQRAGLGWGTTVYHLDRLERAQMVTSERAGLHRCYFPTGALSRGDRKSIGVLKADTTRSVAAFLVARPGASQTDLCEGLGLSASAASKQVTKLEQAGLVRRERDGKTVRLFAAEGLPPLLGEDGAPAAPASAAAAFVAPGAASA